MLNLPGVFWLIEGDWALAQVAQIVESPSLEIISHLDMVLGNLFWVPLLVQWVWTRWPAEIPSSLSCDCVTLSSFNMGKCMLPREPVQSLLTWRVILFFTSKPIFISIKFKSFSSCWLDRIFVTTSSLNLVTSSSSWKSKSLWSKR